MSAVAATTERDLLAGARQGYERRGLRFVAEPSGPDIPEFLRGHRPDAIAFGPAGGGVVVEVARDGRPAGRMRLADLADLVARQPGWALDVIYFRERPEDAPTLRPAEDGEIARRVEEAEDLLAAGHTRAALLLGWAALEARLRATISDEDATLARRPFSPFQAVERLAMDGLLDPNAARRLRGMAAVRNAVAHGDFSVEAEPADVSWLLSEVRRLLPEPVA